MTNFIKNVDVKTKVNIYDEGKVQSRTIRYPDGRIQTLGVYLPGEYEFESEGAEKVVMTTGSVSVLFPSDSDWRIIKRGETYDVPANTRFKVRCAETAEYICDFL